jgi:hypothetical protein
MPPINPEVFRVSAQPRPTPNMPAPQPAPFDYGNQSPGFFGTGTYQANPHSFDIPRFAEFQNYISGQLGNVGDRPAPQVDGSQQGEFRDYQSLLARSLLGQASGQGPSLAQGQFQQSTDRNLAQALALSQAAGPNNAGALRNVAYRRGAISQQAAGDAAQLRLQEQMQAENQLGQVLAGARGQDLGLASDNAQLQAGQNQMNQQALQFYLSQGMSLAQAQAQANIALEQIRSGAFSNSANNAMGKQIVGGLLNAGGAFAGGYASGLGGG